jgi:CHAD domain-containing protein
MVDDREVEWQLDAVDLRPVRRWLEARPPDAISLEPAGTTLLRDRYLDTDDWRLHRAGITLRVRGVGRRTEATAKTMAAPVGGLRDRRELTEPLPSGDVRQAQGEVGRLIRSLAGRRGLRPLFAVRTRRERFAVRSGGEVVGELSLDDTSFPVEGGPPARLQRVEIEVDPRRVEEVSPFVDQLRAACGLRPAGASKFEAGLLAAGLAPPSQEDLGPTDVGGGMTVGELAFAVLRTQFAVFLEHEPGVRLGDDPEEVHDMRVAIRRMRAAMSVFREALPVRTQRLRDELKWVAGVLGDVRDLDVQLDQLREWERDMPAEDREALARLLARLDERRRDARARLLQQLDSRRYERLVTGATDLLRRGPLRRSPASRIPVSIAAPDLVRRRRRPVRKRGRHVHPDSPPEELHALRIRCKRLRYTVEFLSPLAPGPSRRFVRRLVAVQDLLGEHQDAQVAMERIRLLVEADLPPRAVFLLGRISERYARRAEDLRAELPRVYGRTRGKPWRRLRDALDASRAKAVDALPPRRAPSLRTAPLPEDRPERAPEPGGTATLTVVGS